MPNTDTIAVILTDTHLYEKRTMQDAIIDCNYENVEKAFIEAMDLAENHGLDTVYHGGDFFDSRKHQSQPLMEMFWKILELFRARNLKLVMIAGNHDRTDYSSEFSFLFNSQHHPNLHLVSKYDYIDDKKHNIRFHLLAFFDNDIYVDILKSDALSNIHPEMKNVLITHIGIHGVLKNDGEKEESSITFRMFEDFDKVLIGHYHDYSSHINGKIVYIGSACQNNFGENAKKGITLLSSNLDLARVKTNFKEFKTLVVDVKDIQKNDISSIIDNQKVEYQRLILTGDENLIKAFDKSKLIEQGVKIETKPNKIELKKVEQRLDAHNTESIFENFTNFCTDNQYIEPEGLIYLKPAIKPVINSTQA
jgi:DNA repair exonuclease SbcCD nuclease subunit